MSQELGIQVFYWISFHSMNSERIAFESFELALYLTQDALSKVATCAELCIEKVDFSVGRYVFSSTKTSLLRIKGTYFHGLLGGGGWKKSERGCYEF